MSWLLRIWSLLSVASKVANRISRYATLFKYRTSPKDLRTLLAVHKNHTLLFRKHSASDQLHIPQHTAEAPLKDPHRVMPKPTIIDRLLRHP
ncbi:hypothetical protein BJX96DRAFT_142336 [Aspergillus floccosus]